ncbi:MAG: hypothetical protein IKL52_01635 [Candidatus Gastranaerophilales bacterium]|nr:hypothetical protein [Candidatus Gastranaerophilales bacterium]
MLDKKKRALNLYAAKVEHINRTIKRTTKNVFLLGILSNVDSSKRYIMKAKNNSDNEEIK